MITTVKPGSRLELYASLEIVPPREGFPGASTTVVIDRWSGEVVSLASLLESFREDPGDNIIGPVRIVVEPAT